MYPSLSNQRVLYILAVLYSFRMNILLLVFFPALAYLSGSLPFSIWVTRYVKGVDVRDAGSGHATTTNTIRQAGFGWGALVLMLDIAKGFLPTYLALTVGRDVISPYIVPLTAACAVIGHCWPLFAQFRGGMGLATFGGALLAVNWLAFVIGLGLLLLLTLTIHHGARASVFTGILMTPVFWLFHLRGMEFWIAIAGGLVIAYRFLIDWNRKYRELWLDREKKA
ncbi:MAG TPA: glycerol-3-phosphate acyltransferase [Anaerolineales bacterium]|nr:glycerol-3-phosphate acyltransferase [Anaerolineales bacterium]